MRESQTKMSEVRDNRSSGQKPFLQLRAGTIALSAWENEGKVYDGKASTFVTLKLQRSYQKDGKWENTDSFRVNDIPVLKMLLTKCFEKVKLNAKSEDIQE